MATRAGSFRLLDTLGEGGMGVVYRGEGPDGATAAIKLMRRELDFGTAAERFRMEAQIRVDHPNVIRVLDTGVADDGSPFIAFELLEGEGLDERLSRGPLSVAEAVDVARQACLGLQAAHAVGVIHRDLKPSNLFLCRDGPVKLLDFGIALSDSRLTRMTLEGSVVGTPAYLAPEQARGEKAIDARVDIWALGTVLYEAIGGQPPFLRETPLATMVAVLLEEVPPLHAQVPGTPASLIGVVERSLKKERAERWASALELRAALDEVETEGVEAHAAAQPAKRPAFAQTLMDDQRTTMIDELPPSGLVDIDAENRILAILLAEEVTDFVALGQLVESWGGVLHPLLGRRALGVFGGKRWRGDEPMRAAAAALEAQRSAKRLAVASGRGHRSQQGISGDVLAAAESACARVSHGVVVEPNTVAILEGRFGVKDVGDGFRQLLDRRKQTRTEFDVQPAGELFGREMERAQIELALATAVDEEEATCIAICGEPGIGKTRLCTHAEGWLRNVRPVPDLLYGGLDVGGGRALSLFSDAIGGHLTSKMFLKGGDETGDILRDAFPASSEQDENRADSFLRELLSLPVASSPELDAARQDPALMADRLRMAIFDYFAHLCSLRPVALIVDLSRADATSIEVLDELLVRLQDRPFIVVAELRPEVLAAHPNLFVRANLMRIDLRPLRKRHVAMMARACASRPLSDAVVAAIGARTGGNPLFIQQIVASLLESGEHASLEDLPLPMTVEAAVQSRLDGLKARQKEIAKVLAVLARPATVAELGLLGYPAATDELEAAVQHGLMTKTAETGSEARYWFAAPLFRDVAYRMIPATPRRELHARAAEVVRSAGAEPELIAVHFERAGQHSAAAEYYQRAAFDAGRRGDGAAVLRHSERALELGAKKAYELHLARADAFRFHGLRQEQADELESALAHVRGDEQVARVLTEQAVWLSRVGRWQDALEAADAAVDAARDLGEAKILATALGWKAVSQAYAGNLPDSRDALAEACACMPDEPAGLALAAEWRAQVASVVGDLGGRLHAFEDAVRLYREAGHVRRSVGAEVNLADVYNRVGDYARAEKALRDAVSGCRHVGNRLMEGYAHLNLGYCLSKLGRHVEAMTSLEHAEQIGSDNKDSRLTAAVAVYRCRAQVATSVITADDADLAIRSATLAEDAGVPSVAATGFVLAARAQLRAGNCEGALETVRRADAIRERLGGLEEDEGELFLAHAEILRANGLADEAEKIIGRGVARLRAIAAPIADERLRQQFLHHISEHDCLLKLAEANSAN